MRCAQRERALVIALRHGAQRRFRDADDGRQDHDAEHDGGRDDALAAAEHGLQGRDEHDKAEEAIDDGRDAGQQIDGGLQHAASSAISNSICVVVTTSTKICCVFTALRTSRWRR